MIFADAARKKGLFTRTENGAVAIDSTGSKLLDLFSTIGSLREADSDRIDRLFADAYAEDPLIATKIVFYARDIRGGLGERKTFRELIRYMAELHPEALRPNLDLIGVYGRYDDLYSLIGTPLEEDMWAAMKAQFEEDLKNYHADKAISLLAKWIKTADASSENTRKLGILTAQKLGYPVYNFKRIVRSMRKRIGVIESLMAAGRWDEIDYPAVPSRAMMLYRRAFRRHDEKRYTDFVNAAVNGEETIHAGTLYPYDLVEKVFDGVDDMTVEAQWRQLPDYVGEGMNALVIADTSGSMNGRPLATSVGLALYFAERNKGAYHGMWMSFSLKPEIQLVKGETLRQKIQGMDMGAWDMNTNLKAAFALVLDIAKKNNVPPEDMPKSLIVISDMEIDYCGDKEWTFYEKMQKRFRKAGYEIPNIIFWNVNSRHDIFHTDSTRQGVQLFSGQSASTFKQLMASVGMTPVEAMLSIINSERYDAVRVEQKG
ncbi:MAG: DUF2828 family protein [Lachnospiraceae bacterium]|nr:DUF2828 family protein [Lachnospiraceae bacterium]